MLIIGDVHGKVDKYHKIIKGTTEPTVQVGDFGLQHAHDWMLENVDCDRHKVLFGNHDFYPYLLDKKHSLTPSFLMDFERSILFIRGADSIDKHLRTAGDDWFENEQLSMGEFYELVEKVAEWRPFTIVSHDCPQLIYSEFFNIHEKGNRTSQGLQACFEAWCPQFWIFGHHHTSKEAVVEGTKFICLAELEYLFLNCG